MPKAGVVTATSLNFRESPGGTIMRALTKGAVVEIVDDQGEFLKISFEGRTGFVKASFVEIKSDATPSTGGSNAGEFRFDGKDAVAPDATRFAKRFRLGVFNNGQTSIGEFVAAHPERFANIAPSRLRVMQAVSQNEGKLEAINTWDNSFLTFGAFQWVVGSGAGAGELPALIDKLKQKDAAVFDRFFGSHGLDVSAISAPAGATPTGFFILQGEKLVTPAQKERLRKLEWAFRFWLAGHDDTVRQVEIEHAMSRVDLFYRDPGHQIAGLPISDYISSEYGVALLLDEHVNRPGHVPGTLRSAVSKYTADSGRGDPKVWTDTDESKLLAIYLNVREKTNMTDPRVRGDRIRAAVTAGKASDKRGSYKDA